MSLSHLRRFAISSGEEAPVIARKVSACHPSPQNNTAQVHRMGIAAH
jgi:hypothetical protein